jgi:acetolactate decarboxylase
MILIMRHFSSGFCRLAAAAAVLLVVTARVVLAAGPSAEAKGDADLLAVLSSEPYAPSVKVLDTETSLGPLAREAQTVTLRDLVRYHGHPCDGLVVASAAIAYGLEKLFPEGVVDRTDVVAAVNASPCYGDAAAYLTGARARYATLVIDKSLGDSWILHRRSTGQTVAVRLKDGIKPKQLPGLEKKLRSEGCDAPLIRRVQALQSGYAKRVLASSPDRVFHIEILSSFPYKVGPIRADATKAGCRP